MRATILSSPAARPISRAGSRISRRHASGCERRRVRAFGNPGFRTLSLVSWAPASAGARSEEHTSELQSLMRISYAVFCLKKKKTNATRKLTDNIIKHNRQKKHKKQ